LRYLAPVTAENWFLDQIWLGVPGVHWAILAAAVLGGTPVLLLLRALLAGKLRGLAQRSRTAADDLVVDLLAGTRGWFLALAILRFTALALDVTDRWDRRFAVALGVALALQGAVWASTVVRAIADKRFARHAEAGGPQVVPIAQTLVRFAGLVLVWTLAVLVILSNLGIDITALVAGLGIGGIAVALAVQRVLGDVLASVSIAVDKPFQAGDFIIVGDQMGTVQRVGLRSTVLAGLGGEGLVLPNNDLLASRIRNFARMQERRVVFKVAIPHDTPAEQVEALPALLRGCVEARDKVRFDRANLVNFAESWFDFEVVYYMLSADYNEYARVHEQILLDVLRRTRAAGYRLACPTRDVHLTQPDPAAA
jgi:small-conductance mechanosensitive channel